MPDDQTFLLDRLIAFSTDPAHLFMQLYDLLPDDVFADRTATIWLNEPEMHRRAARVERASEVESGAACRMVAEQEI